MRDSKSNLKIVNAISPQNQTGNTAIVSSTVDLAGYDSCTFGILWGSLADSDMTTVVLLEESDDSGMSGATAVDDSDLIGTEVLAAKDYSGDDSSTKLGYKGIKRYLRLTITPSANSGNLYVACAAILGKAAAAPVA